MPGKIILLNGASSAGKSSLARAVQARAGLPFWHYSIDHLRAGGVLPTQRIDSGDFGWPSMREAFFDGFHRSIAAFAEAGNNLLVEHIIEQRAWMDRLILLLASHDLFFVGLHCSLDALERREMQRGDRRIGEARADHAVAHTFGDYDLELESTQPVADMAAVLLAAWEERSHPCAFARMARRRGFESAA